MVVPAFMATLIFTGDSFFKEGISYNERRFRFLSSFFSGTSQIRMDGDLSVQLTGTWTGGG